MTWKEKIRVRKDLNMIFFILSIVISFFALLTGIIMACNGLLWYIFISLLVIILCGLTTLVTSINMIES